MKLSLRFAFFFAFALLPLITWAQTPTVETLTNAKIISMVKAALPKTAIITSIQNKPSNFDTSTDAMIALKKQGVPDDVITAMVNKVSKPEPAVFPTSPVKTVAPVLVNTKDCKYTKAQLPDGSKVQMVQSGARFGNFMIGKADGKYTIVYNTKSLISALITDTKNVASLKIDSVQFLFTDNTVISVKPTLGIGTAPNKSDELQPHLTNVRYGITLEPGSKAEVFLRQTRLKGFRVLAQKDAQYADLLNDKQQAQLLQAFVCAQ